jgi:hypothetical protein
LRIRPEADLFSRFIMAAPTPLSGNTSE